MLCHLPPRRNFQAEWATALELLRKARTADITHEQREQAWVRLNELQAMRRAKEAGEDYEPTQKQEAA